MKAEWLSWWKAGLLSSGSRHLGELSWFPKAIPDVEISFRFSGSTNITAFIKSINDLNNVLFVLVQSTKSWRSAATFCIMHPAINYFT